MKYDAEFWNTRSVQKCAQNSGSNVRKSNADFALGQFDP